MKRKLIKRNKQFLSSRYDKYCGGSMSFQNYYEFSWVGLSLTKDRVKWAWQPSDGWVDTLSEILANSCGIITPLVGNPSKMSFRYQIRRSK